MRLDGEDRLRSVLIKSRRPLLSPSAFTSIPASSPIARFEGRAVLLDLPDGTRWMFSAEDMPIAIEESIFFAAPDGSHATRQLVIYSNVEQPASVAWTLRAIMTQEEYEDTQPEEA